MTYPQPPASPQPAPGPQPAGQQAWPGQPAEQGDAAGHGHVHGYPPPTAGHGYPQPAPGHGYPTPGYGPGYPPPTPGYGYGYPPPTPPPVSPSGERLAEFSDRLLARLVDYAIFFVIGMILEIPLIIFIFKMTTDAASSQSPDPAAMMVRMFGLIAVVSVLSLMATYVYEVEMMYRRGQTVGKRILKIRVTTLDGAALTRSIAAKRWLASNVAAAFIPAYNWVDGLWQLWDKPYRQCLHDKFASTVVVKGEPPRGVA